MSRGRVHRGKERNMLFGSGGKRKESISCFAKRHFSTGCHHNKKKREEGKEKKILPFSPSMVNFAIRNWKRSLPLSLPLNKIAGPTNIGITSGTPSVTTLQ